MRLTALVLLTGMLAQATVAAFDNVPSAPQKCLAQKTGEGSGRGRPTRYPYLEPGAATRVRLDLADEPYEEFRIEIPEDALMLEIEISAAEADLDLYLRYDEPMDSYDQADFSSESYDFNESFRVSVFEREALQPGTYYIDVFCPGGDTVRVDGRRVDALEFEVTCYVRRAAETVELEAGRPLEASTAGENGYARFFAVDVPNNAECLRLDLTDTDISLDMYARRGERILALEDADYEDGSWTCSKTLIIDENSDPPLQPGSYYQVTVVDPFLTDIPAPFRIQASFDRATPAELLAIPPLPQPRSPMERALFSTVHLVVGDGGGSGVLISPDGLLLTNQHVVALPNGQDIHEEVVIAPTFDVRQPPPDMFRGRVLFADKNRDLALVQIVSGFYGQPIPEGYAFPYVTLKPTEEVQISEPILVGGFPDVAGYRLRSSINVSRGIVSGFERRLNGALIRTDADFHSGNSGGGAFNADLELIGLPTEILRESGVDAVGFVGVLTSVSLIPAEWFETINEHLPSP